MSDLVGKRVELVRMDDPYSNLEPGTRGTVTLVDSMDTVHVNWDPGQKLGLIPGHDRWVVVDDEGGSDE